LIKKDPNKKQEFSTEPDEKRKTTMDMVVPSGDVSPLNKEKREDQKRASVRKWAV